MKELLNKIQLRHLHRQQTPAMEESQNSEEAMSREETIFAIYYSHELQRITSVVTGRIDKVLTFALLLLGSSVMASVGNSVFIGFCVAIIAALQNTFKLGAKSESSRSRSQQYLNLYTASETMSFEVLLTQFMGLQENDITTWLSLENIAEYRSERTLKGSSSIKLSSFEKVINAIC
ncbi:hypothetical protein [Phytobacter diazotrophicus]|uniref:hypothetical protein n=1 Tax=Phytobacter diazotrophicus TaxID=395631 RepID=UPI002935F6F8|nr:hypothetical protein [Phytobacter diazotrophicus]MDV2871356.1 hypothetical protein [Phytobacter diazotrophicus]